MMVRLMTSSLPSSSAWFLGLLAIMVTTTSMVAADSSDSSCTLNCPADAPCQLGEADFSSHEITLEHGSSHGMHCACPYGWTGILCDHRYETCDNSHRCYHGGECISGSTDNFGNDQLFCDCTKAIAADGTQYVGKYCETPFEKICDHTGEHFCVNSGDCNPNYPTLDANPCLCPDGFEGIHCEFKKGTVPDCTLDCQNDGVCVVGIHDPAEMDRMKHIWSKEDIDSHQRCLCKDGYGGPLCEASSEDCGGDACYHGGTCVETVITDTESGTSIKEFHCDCTTAGDRNNLYAGYYCQHPSTTFCSDVDENLFCTNKGTCKDDPLEGCDCPEGWTGFKCDYLDGNYFAEDDDDDDDYDDDDDDAYAAELCGDVYCFNNGKCVTTTIEQRDGTTTEEKTCDCSETFDGQHFFAGSSCQYKSTEICDKENGSFCVHSGSCKTDGSCECQTGWKGEFCEIHDLEDKKPEDEQCGGNICRNGGTCVQTKIIKSVDVEEIIFSCDCSTALSEDGSTFYAGDSCQFPSTSTCQYDQHSTTPMFCTNHGSCANTPGRGCKCPDGFLGFRCEVEDLKENPDNSYDVVADQFEECGDLVCHHGGKCVTSLIYDQNGGNTEVKHCDCTTAVTDESVWTGDSCQYEATTFCSEPTEGHGLESTFFCANGGRCRDHIREGCDCPAGWKGFRCEFPETKDDMTDDTSRITKCGDLNCHNGATCEEILETNENTGEQSKLYACDCGAASSLTEENVFFAGNQCEYRSTDLCSKENPKGSFCVNGGTCTSNAMQGCDCPAGWTGPMCEISVLGDEHAEKGEQCGDGYCYNGGSCVETKIIDGDSSVIEYHCDCTPAYDDNNIYGGKSCEHKQTSICSRSNQGESLAGVEWCANGGTCSEKPNQGCDCPEGWTGFSCEFQVNDDDDFDGDFNGDDEMEVCGDLVCLNKGKCVTTTITGSDGTMMEIPHCDCSTAFTDTDIFSGSQCEYKQTQFCSKPAEGMDLSSASWCTNGGSCPDSLHAGCDCPAAFAGFRCEYQKDPNYFTDKVDDPLVVDEYVECGDNYCFHGGECNAYVLDNGETEYKCDCTTAATGSTLYAGRFCQYQMTSLCTKTTLDSLAGADFCVNNGVCPSGEGGEGDEGCKCPSGYKGYRCDESIYAHYDNEDNIAPDLDDDDFDDDDDDDTIYECKLQCQNGGTCAKGAKDLSHFHDQIGHVSHLNKTYDHEYFEHCICKEGWFGLECEHKAEVCGQNEHLCLHGSTCVKEDDKHGCDCSTATEQIGDTDHSVFAGDSCQHPATDICIVGDNFLGRPLYFCTNQGTCKNYVSQTDPDPGCDCLDGWTGPHCEIRIGKQNLSRKQGDDLLLYVLGSTFIISILSFSAFYIYRRCSSSDPSTGCMRLRRRRKAGYDPDSSTNLAPRTNFSDSFGMDPPPSRPFFRSGSDPMTAFVLPPESEPELFVDEPKTQPYRDEPDFEPEPESVPEETIVVNVGPLTDEDGHQLHNVDIL